MSPIGGIAAALTRSIGFRIPTARKSQSPGRGGRAVNRRVKDVNRRTGVAHASSRRRLSIRLIPVWVLGGVAAALVIAHVRVELIQQGYQRANNV